MSNRGEVPAVPVFDAVPHLRAAEEDRVRLDGAPSIRDAGRHHAPDGERWWVACAAPCPLGQSADRKMSPSLSFGDDPCIQHCGKPERSCRVEVDAIPRTAHGPHRKTNTRWLPKSVRRRCIAHLNRRGINSGHISGDFRQGAHLGKRKVTARRKPKPSGPLSADSAQ